MKVSDLLKNSKDRFTFSLEFIPPSKEATRTQFLKMIEPFMEYNPLFVNVTTHRNSTELVQTPEGMSVYEHTKHISTLPICDSIAQKFGVLVVPHVMCGGFTKDETEDLLLDAHYLEIENLFAVRGDALSVQKSYIPGPGENVHSVELIEQIMALNNAHYRDSYIKNPVRTHFCVGSTFYPEKHLESPNFEWEYKILQMKYELGAEFFISQMFFNNAAFYKFVNKLKEFSDLLIDWNTILVPALKVITTKRQLQSIPQTFSVRIPQSLIDEYDKDPNAGIDFAVKQCKDLISHGYNHIHFFTSNNKAVLKVLEQL